MPSRSSGGFRAPVSRRQFISSAVSAGAALAVFPRSSSARTMFGQAAAATPHFVPAGRPLRLACIGIGNRGKDMVKTFAATGLVSFAAFCDIDLDGPHTKESRELFPAVPCFSDFREMFAKAGDTFDAVVVATPDHSHFPLAMHAMRQGKHVYVEKPLAQTFHEVELLMAAARHTGVVTQMGNQGHSGNNYFQFKAWTEAGVIKDVTRIVAFMNSERRWHGWKMDGFPSEPLPRPLDWDGWHASREVRPFSSKLHPETWRGWFAYGTGAFGDWGAHILDTAHQFLELGLPHTVEAIRRDEPSEFIFPQATTIRFEFAARDAMPPVEVFWYDGVNNRPPLPEALGPEATLTEREGKFIYSKDLVFKGGTHGDTLRIIPEARMREMAPSLPRLAGGFSDHAVNFVRACQGREETRSPFHVAGPLTQVFLLGIVAQRLGGRLAFDTTRRQFIGNELANQVLRGPAPRKGWENYYRT